MTKCLAIVIYLTSICLANKFQPMLKREYTFYALKGIGSPKHQANEATETTLFEIEYH